MDILPLLKRLAEVDAKHFGWGTKRISDSREGSTKLESAFVIVYLDGARVFDIPEDAEEAELEYLDEAELIYSLIRVVSESGMRFLLWQEENHGEREYFVRIWKPDISLRSAREVKGNNLFATICSAYISNWN